MLNFDINGTPYSTVRPPCTTEHWQHNQGIFNAYHDGIMAVVNTLCMLLSCGHGWWMGSSERSADYFFLNFSLVVQECLQCCYQNFFISATHNCGMFGSHPNYYPPTESQKQDCPEMSPQFWLWPHSFKPDQPPVLHPASCGFFHWCELIKTTWWCPVSHALMYLYSSQEHCLGPVLCPLIWPQIVRND